MASYTYKTNGTCAKQIHVELDGKIIKSVSFDGGCNGNLKGVSKLVQGQDIDSVIKILRGITCKNKPTSCPDQLSYALEEAYAYFKLNN